MKGLILGLTVSAALLVTSAPALAQKGCADTNKDGVVNVIDAARILQLVADLYNPGNILLHMWDADGNGQIQSTDATIVLQYDAGLINELPECL
ncbi:MAG: dockerin type I domain-containing protein [Dehalococcoidia bacterium]